MGEQIAQIVAAQLSFVDALDGNVGFALDEDEDIDEAVLATGGAHEQVEHAVGFLRVEVGVVQIRHGFGVEEGAGQTERVEFRQQPDGVVARA